MNERAVVILSLVVSWLVLGCSGELRVLGDDDATGDDDDAVGDDDDAVGDDDDAVGDDDDAVGDDDDDDDSLPNQPGIVFTIPSGDLAGDYEYFSHPFCGEWDEALLLSATEDGDWNPGLELYLYEVPQPNDHITWEFGIYLWDDEDWGWGDGGPHCTFDTGPESWPHTTGFFECAELYYEPEFGPGFMFEIVDGAVRCP